MPVARVWRTDASRDALWLFAASQRRWSASAVRAVDAWWYLQFLLPAWPVMMPAPRRSPPGLAQRPATWRAVVAAVLAAIGVNGVRQAVQRDAFTVARGSRNTSRSPERWNR
jgi:hypothetical protein